MQLPFDLKSLHDAGGWVFASLCIAGMLYAMVKGMIVPRFLYDEQKDRAERALNTQDDTLKSLDHIIRSIDAITSALMARASGKAV